MDPSVQFLIRKVISSLPQTHLALALVLCCSRKKAGNCYQSHFIPDFFRMLRGNMQHMNKKLLQFGKLAKCGDLTFTIAR